MTFKICQIFCDKILVDKFKECPNYYNCMKYIEKKKRQWETYKAMAGIKMDNKKNQSKIEKILIDVNVDVNEEIIDKIKNISKKEFQIIETKKYGYCLFYLILKSIKERIVKHTELRQIVCDYIENDGYESDAIFEEEKCKTKYEYIKKLRRNREYANDIALEAMTKITNIIIGIYIEDKRYENNPRAIIDITKEKK